MATASELCEEALLLTDDDVSQLTREQIVNYLRVLNVPYTSKDSTVRLISHLQGAIGNVKRADTDDGSAKHEDASAGSSEPIIIMMQMMQQQMKLQEDRFLREQERRDLELSALLSRIGLSANGGAGDTSGGDPRQREISTKISIRPPELLEDGVTLKSFKKWETSWKNYSQITKLNEKPREDQIAIFWTFCKPEFLQRVRHAVEIPLDTTLSLNEVIEQIKKYLKDQRNVAVDRYKLVRRKQDAGECFDDFLVDLRERAEDASLAEMTSDEWIATLIVSGVRDEETRQELLSKKPTLNLAETISLCRNRELAEREDKRLGMESASAINATKFKLRERSRSNNRRIHHVNGPSQEERLKCRKCGFPPHQIGRQCPAIGKTCHYCGFTGHFSKVCEKQRRGKETTLSPKVTLSPKSWKLKHMAEVSFYGQERPMLPIEFHHPKTGYLAKMNVVADTGAQKTVAGMGMLQSLGLQKNNLQHYEEHLESVNGKRLRIIGGVDLVLKNDGMQCTENIIFCRDVKFDDMYLSLRACKNLGIVHEAFPLPAKKFEVIGRNKPVTVIGHCIDNKVVKSTDQETEAVEKHILQTYKEVFDAKGYLQTMKTPPMKIQLKEDAKPFAIYAARPVSYPLREAVKKELEDMTEQGIIERVGDRPTEWCHPIVVVPKPTGGIRMTVDLTKLNSQVHRTVHNSKIPHDVINEVVQDARYFTVLDAVKGYWQLELHEDSRDLTTFLTPWGRFRYKRAPMGFISTGDSYNFKGDLAIDGLERTHKVVDDILIASRTFEEHKLDVCAFLDRCVEHGITLNSAKFKFAQPSVCFAGFILSTEGRAVDPNKVRAITKFTTPTNITELRSFMGMVNQLGSFCSHISATCMPLRDLLKSRNQFQWLPAHSEAFEKVKGLITKTPVLAQFDPGRMTRLETDASRLKGFGFSLLQKHEEGWKLVACGSRFLFDVETRYSMIELEALAIKYAILKCKLYLHGLSHFTVITDHRPLLPLFNRYSLNQVENLKLQNLKADLQSQFQFTVEWRKGSDHAIADCLSRAPVDDPDPTEDECNERTVMAVRIASVCDDREFYDNGRAVDPIVEQLQEEARNDPDYVKLVHAITDDTFEHKDTPSCVKQYKAISHNLSIDGNLVLFGRRLVIPKQQRKEVLERLHAAHQGITRTKQRARMCVYWPGITNEITQLIEKCEVCQRHLPSLGKETLKTDPLPTRPFECVSADLFYYGGQQFLIYADRLCGYPMVHGWRDSPSARQVINAFIKMMALTGYPQRIRTDGGPQFKAAEFQRFLKEKGIKWSPSSPHFPSSNGHAEVIVKKVKNLLTKLENATMDERFHEAILELRNTPNADGRSPNQVVFGRNLRSLVPSHHSTLMPDTHQDIKKAEKKRSERERTSMARYNASATDLKVFVVGDKIRIQDATTKEWNKTGEIIKVGPRNRCYFIRLSPNGKLCWRNRRYLRKHHGGVVKDEMYKSVDELENNDPRRSSRIKMKTVLSAL